MSSETDRVPISAPDVSGTISSMSAWGARSRGTNIFGMGQILSMILSIRAANTPLLVLFKPLGLIMSHVRGQAGALEISTKQTCNL